MQLTALSMACTSGFSFLVIGLESDTK